MPETSYSEARLQAEVEEVLDRIVVSNETIVVTRHGRPVVRLVPVLEKGPLTGTVQALVVDDELIAPFDEPRDASSRSSDTVDEER